MDIYNEIEFRIPIEGEETEYEVEGLWLGDLGQSLYNLHALYTATLYEADRDESFASELEEYLSQISANLDEGGSPAYADGGENILDPVIAENIRNEIYPLLTSRDIIENSLESREDLVEDTEFPLYLVDAEKYNPFELAVIGAVVVAVVVIAVIGGTTIETEGDRDGITRWKIRYSGQEGMDAVGDLPATILKNMFGGGGGAGGTAS